MEVKYKEIEEKYKPVVMTLKFETRDELFVFNNMIAHVDTIPNTLYNGDGNGYKVILIRMMQKIFDAMGGWIR